MPKLKSNRGAKKRFQLKPSGKIKRHKAFRSHLKTKKSPDRKRRLREAVNVKQTDARAVKKLISPQ